MIDYHRSAFVRLRDPEYWGNYIDKLKQYNIPGVRITFPSFEIHSLKYGDHVVVSRLQDLELPPAGVTVVELRDQVLGCREHHHTHRHGIGYQSNFRGYNWDFFKQGAQTPFVEIYSRHGGSEGSIGPFGMYHDMGPRDYGGSMEAGLKRGFKFAMVASSDSHAGHPGGFGDGRMAALAPALTRDDIWEAIPLTTRLCNHRRQHPFGLSHQRRLYGRSGRRRGVRSAHHRSRRRRHEPD